MEQGSRKGFSVFLPWRTAPRGDLVMHTLLAFLPLAFPFPTYSLVMCPGITSQLNYLYPHPFLWVCLGRTQTKTLPQYPSLLQSFLLIAPCLISFLATLGFILPSYFPAQDRAWVRSIPTTSHCACLCSANINWQNEQGFAIWKWLPPTTVYINRLHSHLLVSTPFLSPNRVLSNAYLRTGKEVSWKGIRNSDCCVNLGILATFLILLEAI